MANYQIIVGIEIPEEVAGKMDSKWSGLESDRVLLEGDENSEGYLEALINNFSVANIPDGLDLLYEIIGRKFKVELIPSDYYDISLKFNGGPKMKDD